MRLTFLSALKQFKKERQPIPDGVFEKPLYFIAFGFGSGIMPFAPGTFGTLFAAFLYCLLPQMTFYSYLAFTVIVTLISMYVCDKASREIHIHDHPGMCLDEFPGFFVTMLFAPTGCLGLVLGFVLFRFFDIIKPWPINWLDKNVHGGVGMVLDDVVAGLFASVLFIVLKLLLGLPIV